MKPSEYYDGPQRLCAECSGLIEHFEWHQCSVCGEGVHNNPTCRMDHYRQHTENKEW